MDDGSVARTPGELLREGRTARQLSLEQVAEQTKISARLLEAIERDEYHKLSGTLYVKSFLRNYAAAVGLDSEAILAVYEHAAGAAPDAPGATEAVWAEEQTRVRRVGVSPAAVVRAVVLVAAGLALAALAIWRLVFANAGG